MTFVPVAPTQTNWRNLRLGTLHLIFSDLPLTRGGGVGLIPKSLGGRTIVAEMPTPTGRELEILKVLWEHGPASVRGVADRLQVNKDLAYNTVQTLLRIMEEKGLVAHRVHGRTFVYSPCFSRDDSAARFLDRVFDGAVEELVQSLLRRERISPSELERLQAMIGEARKKRKSD
jgi:BlaI family penicillinase repressor